MKKIKLVDIDIKPARTKLIALHKSYKKRLRKNKITSLIKMHFLLINDFEYDIFLSCRDFLRYFLVAIILLSFLSRE